MILLGRKRHLKYVNGRIVSFPLHFHKNPMIAGRERVKLAFEIFKEPILSVQNSLHLSSLEGNPSTFYSFIPIFLLCKIANCLHNHNATISTTLTYFDGENYKQKTSSLEGEIMHIPSKRIEEAFIPFNKTTPLSKNPELHPERIVKKWKSLLNEK